MKLTKEQISNLVGRFTWNFSNEFHIETSEGNFIWKDPGYAGGDGSIQPTDLTYKKWISKHGVSFGRDKGTHRIGDYCGSDFTLA